MWSSLVSVQFDMNVDYKSPKLAPLIVDRALTWAGVSSKSDVSLVIGEAMRLIGEGARDEEFIQWCRNSHGSNDLNFIDKRWARLIYGSLLLATYADRQRESNLLDAELRPYWRYFAGSEHCAGHAPLNGYIARWDSTIWEFIYPPNGWMCGCAVLSLSEDDLEIKSAKQRRVSERMKQRCTQWIDKRPVRQLGLLAR